MKIYLYHHRGKRVSTDLPDGTTDQDIRDARFFDVITDMTKRGKTAAEIAHVVGYSANWVAKFRLRHGIELPLDKQRRPRTGSRLAPIAKTPAAPRVRVKKIPADKGRTTAVEARVPSHFQWLPPQMVINEKVRVIIPPLREAQPASKTRRMFDPEDTDEL